MINEEEKPESHLRTIMESIKSKIDNNEDLTVPEMKTLWNALSEVVNDIESRESLLKEEVERLKSALSKINEIRNSIVGLQKINWSEHVYPLVEYLNDAGLKGMEFSDARENFGTMLERTVKAESKIQELEQKNKELREALNLLNTLSYSFQNDGLKDKIEKTLKQ